MFLFPRRFQGFGRAIDLISKNTGYPCGETGNKWNSVFLCIFMRMGQESHCPIDLPRPRLAPNALSPPPRNGKTSTGFTTIPSSKRSAFSCCFCWSQLKFDTCYSQNSLFRKLHLGWGPSYRSFLATIIAKVADAQPP